MNLSLAVEIRKIFCTKDRSAVMIGILLIDQEGSYV